MKLYGSTCGEVDNGGYYTKQLAQFTCYYKDSEIKVMMGWVHKTQRNQHREFWCRNLF
jgi:hypothetical protein